MPSAAATSALASLTTASANSATRSAAATASKLGAPAGGQFAAAFLVSAGGEGACLAHELRRDSPGALHPPRRSRARPSPHRVGRLLLRAHEARPLGDR